MMVPGGSIHEPSFHSPIIESWWFRITVTFLVAVSAVIISGILFHDNNFTVVFLYGSLTVLMLLLENLRRGGSIISSGIGFTRSTTSQLGSGSLYAVVMLSVMCLAVILLGGSFSSSGVQIPFVEFSILTISSAGEEVLFRGTVFQALRERFGPLGALSATSLVFGAAHAANPGVTIMATVNVVLAGWLLGTMVLLTHSMWTSISFHVVWNSCIYLFIGSVSGHEFEPIISAVDFTSINENWLWLVSGPFGIEQGGLTTVLLIGATILSYRILKPDAEIEESRNRRGEESRTRNRGIEEARNRERGIEDERR